MFARIYRPSQSTMQSGHARAKDWILEFEPASACGADPLTGWISSDDMNGQVRMSFESQEQAVAYAQAHGIAFRLSPARDKKPIIKAYADNFAFARKVPWSH